MSDRQTAIFKAGELTKCDMIFNLFIAWFRVWKIPRSIIQPQALIDDIVKLRRPDRRMLKGRVGFLVVLLKRVGSLARELQQTLS
jgi:hypothetical protein